jgi:hypothetical protein
VNVSFIGGRAGCNASEVIAEAMAAGLAADLLVTVAAKMLRQAELSSERSGERCSDPFPWRHAISGSIGCTTPLAKRTPMSLRR